MDSLHSHKELFHTLFLFGDFNFYTSEEDEFLTETKLADLWKATHIDSHLGYTFDPLQNSWTKTKYFGLAKRQSRFDRIVISQESLGTFYFPKSPMKIFANQPIYPDSSWDYLFCSDHFGLHVDVTNDPKEACQKDDSLELGIIAPSTKRAPFYSYFTSNK
jgi:hypothetical protein